MKYNKLAWPLVLVLTIIVALFGYKFTVGNVQSSDDGRQAILLSKDERNALLLEMRVWLQSAQVILTAASEKDFDTVIKSAKASGIAAEADVPGSLFRKIPAQMKMLGFDTRQKFDDIAMDAEKFKDSNHTVKKLSIAMSNCVVCHAAYRFVEESQ